MSLVNKIVNLKRRRDLRNAMIALRDADPVNWAVFEKQFLRDTHVFPPRFYAKPEKAEVAEALRRLGMSYFTILAGDDPQQIITRLEEAQNETSMDSHEMA